MAIEQKWPSVAPQLFTANGTFDGIITIASTYGFKVKQKVALSGTALPDLQLQVKRVISDTQMKVGSLTPLQGQWQKGYDITLYTVAAVASVRAEEQDKAKLKPDDIWQAIYDQEPTVALRSVLVDQLGRYYDTVIDTNGMKRLAVDAAVSISGVTVDLDAFTKVPPDNAIAVGTEDGTKGGIKHAIKILSNGLLQVQDALAEASLSSIDGKLSSGITITGSVSVSNFPAVQPVSGTVAVSNFPATQPISGSVSILNFPATQPISAVSLPLPTGAATEAKQDVGNASLASIDGKLNSLGQKNKAGSVPVTLATDQGPLDVNVDAAGGDNVALGNTWKEIVDQASASITYIGYAVPGTVTSAALWQIERISVSGSITSIEFADGNLNFDNIWDNRGSLSYS